jgi:hypothetical protein
MTGGWRKLHEEELHTLYSSPIIIRMIKSKRMRWAGHEARMGRRGMHIRYWLEIKKENDRWEARDVCGWTILKWILGRYDWLVWIGLMWLRIRTSGGLL